MFGSFLISFVLSGGHVLLMLHVHLYFYVYWCPTRLPFQIIFVSFNSSTTGEEQELLTLPGHLSSHPGFNGIRVARSLVFCVMFCRLLFFLLLFFLWPLCCLSFFGLRIMITPLVSSSFSLPCKWPQTTIYELMAIESFWQFGAIGSLRKRSEILSRILSTHEGVINAQ
jgi:hypothetical protein